MTNDLEVVDRETGEIVAQDVSHQVSPAQMMKLAREMATEISGFIEEKQLYQIIGGRKHITIDAWLTVAAFHGVVPHVAHVIRHEDNSAEAWIDLRRTTDQVSIMQAVGFAGGPDDRPWNNRSWQQCQSMAVTRATSKACRLCYGYVVQLAGYDPAPPEDEQRVKFGSEATTVPAEYQPPFKPHPSGPPPRATKVGDAEIQRLQQGLTLSGKTEAELCEVMGVETLTAITLDEQYPRALEQTKRWYREQQAKFESDD